MNRTKFGRTSFASLSFSALVLALLICSCGPASPGESQEASEDLGEVNGGQGVSEDPSEVDGGLGTGQDPIEVDGGLGTGQDPIVVDGGLGASEEVLRLRTNGHWFEYQNRRQILIGDSVTQGWMELGNNFQQKDYLDALAKRGVNTVLLWSYIGIVNQSADYRIGYDAPEIWPWEKNDDGTFDLTKRNDAYFLRLRHFINLAKERGIVVVITVHDGWTSYVHSRFSGHPFNKANGGPLVKPEDYVILDDYKHEVGFLKLNNSIKQQSLMSLMHQWYLEQFCERLASETYDLPNVAFEIFNEGEWYPKENLRKFEKHFLDFFKKRTSAPLLVNDDGFLDNIGAETNVSAVSHHKPGYTNSSNALSFYKAYAGHYKASVKPTFFTETNPAFDGKQSFDAQMRLIWGTAMAGSSVVIQNDASFGFDKDDRNTMKNYTSFRDQVLELEGHAARFFNREISLAGMEPKREFVINRDGTRGGICLAAPNREYVVYSQSGAEICLDLAAATGLFTGRFYNPRTGVYDAALHSVIGGKKHCFPKPNNQDWVLHVRRMPIATIISLLLKN